jgi:tetratricopeptide (TPR) repeat protein
VTCVTTTESAAPTRPGKRAVPVALFGKHPLQNEYLPTFGAENEVLIQIRHIFIGGIGEARKDWERWETSSSNKLLAGFDHDFLWLRPGAMVFGAMWSSKDQVNRLDPLVLCGDGGAGSQETVGNSLWAALHELGSPLQEAREIGQLKRILLEAQEKLSAIIALGSVKGESPEAQKQARKSFFERPEFGPERRGWLRILHELRLVLRGFSRSKENGSAQVRVPLGADSPFEALSLWADVLREALLPKLPILLIARNNSPWLDVIIGEPGANSFRCLQASAKAIPLATDTPYDIAPELSERLQQIETALLGPGKRHVPAKWLMTAAVLVLAGVGLVLLLASRQTHSNAQRPAAANALAAPRVEAEEPKPQGTSAPAPAAAISLSVSNHSKAEVKTTNHPPANPEFEKALAIARMAEVSKNFTNALALYWAAQKLNPADVAVIERIKELTPRAQEQMRQQERIQKQFNEAISTAEAAAAVSNYTNALADYQSALKIKEDPRAQAGIAAMQLKIREQSERTVKEQQLVRQFEQSLQTAVKAEQAKDYPAALAAYQAALNIRTNDAQVTGRIKALTQQIDDEKRAEAMRLKQQQDQAEELTASLAAAREADKAGNFTNALAAYQKAQKLKPAGDDIQQHIQELTTKAELHQRAGETNAGDATLQKLDSELEVLMVNFGLAKPEAAKTEKGKKAQLVVGVLSMEDLNPYLAKVSSLEVELRKGGWITQDQRAEKLKKLKNAIQSRN